MIWKALRGSIGKRGKVWAKQRNRAANHSQALCFRKAKTGQSRSAPVLPERLILHRPRLRVHLALLLVFHWDGEQKYLSSSRHPCQINTSLTDLRPSLVSDQWGSCPTWVLSSFTALDKAENQQKQQQQHKGADEPNKKAFSRKAALLLRHSYTHTHTLFITCDWCFNRFIWFHFAYLQAHITEITHVTRVHACCFFFLF